MIDVLTRTTDRLGEARTYNIYSDVICLCYQPHARYNIHFFHVPMNNIFDIPILRSPLSDSVDPAAVMRKK